MVYSMTEILAKEVFLVESLDAKHESTGHIKVSDGGAFQVRASCGESGGPLHAHCATMRALQHLSPLHQPYSLPPSLSPLHLQAICLIRPTAENIRSLMQHLKEPKFLEYHIFFTNFVSQDMLRKLAEADTLGVVKQVQEYYSDFYAINPDLFSSNISALNLAMASKSRGSFTDKEAQAFLRTQQSLLALLLSLKLKPYVRYSSSSDAAAALAREVTGAIGGERDLFTFQKQAGSAPLLLILDRREDPVTPLLSQWTYQAMVHELLPGGIKNNTVDLHHVKSITSDDLK